MTLLILLILIALVLGILIGLFIGTAVMSGEFERLEAEMHTDGRNM
jgi:nitrogen fixation-related uncharacterized protein